MTKTDLLQDLYQTEKKLLSEMTCLQNGEYGLPVFGDGNPDSGIMFIGEAPGADETIQNRPFVGKAGKELDYLLSLSGVERSSVFVTNVVKYRPYNLKNNRKSNRTPSLKEIKMSLPLLEKEIRIIAPGIVATLGNTPLKAIQMIYSLGNEKIGSMHGEPISTELGFILFPLYHPASVIYNRSLENTLNDDIIKFGKLYQSMK